MATEILKNGPRHGDVTPGCRVDTESIFIDYHQLTDTEIDKVADHLRRNLEQVRIESENKKLWITSASQVTNDSVFKRMWDESFARLRPEPDYLKESERYAKYIQSGLIEPKLARESRYEDFLKQLRIYSDINNYFDNLRVRKESETMNNIYINYRGLMYQPDTCEVEVVHCGDTYPEVTLSARLDPRHAIFRDPRSNTTPKFTPKEVIHNNPATIVYWNDGTKTVVKSENEAYDPEKGLAMAYVKKHEGNKGNYYNFFRKHLPDGYETINYKGLYEELVDDANHKSHKFSCAEKAYTALLNVVDNNKALKTDLQAAIEEALGYLGEALGD